MKTAPSLKLSPEIPFWVRDLVQDAYQIGWSISERENYRAGWFWGLVCGITLCGILASLALYTAHIPAHDRTVADVCTELHERHCPAPLVSSNPR